MDKYVRGQAERTYQSVSGEVNFRMKDGRILFEHLDTMIGLDKHSIVLSHIYNQKMEEFIDYRCSKGWKLNFQQYVYKGQNNKYYYIDSYGRTHEFEENNGNYYEPGNGLILTMANSIQIKDLNNNQMLFEQQSPNVYHLKQTITNEGIIINYDYKDDLLIKVHNNKGYCLVFKYRFNKLLDKTEVFSNYVGDNGELYLTLKYHYNIDNQLQTIEKIKGNVTKEVTQFIYDLDRELKVIMDVESKEVIGFVKDDLNSNLKYIRQGYGTIVKSEQKYYLHYLGDNLYLGDDLYFGDNIVIERRYGGVDNVLREEQIYIGNNYTELTYNDHFYRYYLNSKGECTAFLEHTESGLKSTELLQGEKLELNTTTIQEYINNEVVYRPTNNVIDLVVHKRLLEEKHYIASFYCRILDKNRISKFQLKLIIEVTKEEGTEEKEFTFEKMLNSELINNNIWQLMTIPIDLESNIQKAEIKNAQLIIEEEAMPVVDLSNIRMVTTNKTELYVDVNGNEQKIAGLSLKYKDQSLQYQTLTNDLTSQDLLYTCLNKYLSENNKYIIYSDNLTKSYYGSVQGFQVEDNIIPLYGGDENKKTFNWLEKTYTADEKVVITKKMTIDKKINEPNFYNNQVYLKIDIEISSVDSSDVVKQTIYKDLNGKVYLEEDGYGVQKFTESGPGYLINKIQAKNPTSPNNIVVSSSILQNNQKTTISNDLKKVEEYEECNGNLKTVNNYTIQDEFISQIRYEYDQLGEKVTKIILDFNTEINIEYNDRGQVSKISDKNYSYSYTYDENNKLISVKDQKNKELYKYQENEKLNLTNNTYEKEKITIQNGTEFKETYDNKKRKIRTNTNGYQADYRYKSDDPDVIDNILIVDKTDQSETHYQNVYDENKLLKGYTVKYKRDKINGGNELYGIQFTKNKDTYQYKKCQISDFDEVLNDETLGDKYGYGICEDSLAPFSPRHIKSFLDYYPLNRASYVFNFSKGYDEIGRPNQKLYERVCGNVSDYVLKSKSYQQNSIYVDKETTEFFFHNQTTPIPGVNYYYEYEKGMLNAIGNDVYGKKYEYDVSERIYKETKYIVLNSEGITSKCDTNVVHRYNYDNQGNITQKMYTDEMTDLIKTYYYDYEDKLLKSVRDEDNSYQYQNINYDNNGNITSFLKGNKLHLLEWNNNKLERYITFTDYTDTNVEQMIQYKYDIEGRRIQKIINNDIQIDYEYVGNQLIWEEIKYFQNNEVKKTTKFTYTYDEEGINGFILENIMLDDNFNLVVTTNWYHYIRDILGNIAEIYKNNEKVLEYDYDAWGNQTVKYFKEEETRTGVQHNPFRYRGYYYDEETQLYWVSSRYYSPELCRWISPDSIEYLDPESINGLNLYAYCNNDPVNYYDPSGHSALLALGIFALSSLAMWGVSELFGSQIAGGIGSIGGGATAISTGISLCAFGPWGIVAGIALMAVGGLTIAFGANEIVDGAFGTNYIQEWTGWSDEVYNGVYIGLNVASAVGSIAGTIGMRIAANNILNGIVKNPQKIQNYSTKRFGKIASKSSWNYSSAKNGKGMRAVLNDKAIRFNMNGTRFDAAHFYGDPYWVVSSAALGKLKYLYLF